MAQDSYPVLVQTLEGELSQTTADKLTQKELEQAFDEELFIVRYSAEVKRFQMAEIDEPETSEDSYVIGSWSDHIISEREEA